jgi:hypothetical protein
MEELRESPIPYCCDREMTLLRSGRRANFAIWLWRCGVCERFEWTNRRYDGKTFWVGAMGRAVVAKMAELVADAYSTDGPSG